MFSYLFPVKILVYIYQILSRKKQRSKICVSATSQQTGWSNLSGSNRPSTHLSRGVAVALGVRWWGLGALLVRLWSAGLAAEPLGARTRSRVWIGSEGRDRTRYFIMPVSLLEVDLRAFRWAGGGGPTFKWVNVCGVVPTPTLRGTRRCGKEVMHSPHMCIPCRCGYLSPEHTHKGLLWERPHKH